MSAAPGAVVTRVMPAPPEAVYDEWLDQTALAEFMCPSPDTRATTIACDPRIGGKLIIVMGDPAGDVHITGEYVVLDRPRRLSFTWRHAGGVDSVVTITFEPHGEDQTLMTISHVQLPPHLVPGHEAGWTSIAQHLETRLKPRH